MNQLVKYAALLLLAGTFAASCSKDDDTVTKDDAEVVTPAGETVSINVSLPESLTKVSMTPDGDDAGIKLAWESGDQIRVISGSNSQAFTIEDGFTEHAGTFTGTAVTGTSFDILYPGTLASIDEAEAISCGDQVQSGNNSAAHLQYLTVLEGVDTYENVAFTPEWAAAHGGTLKRSGVLRVRVQLPSDVTSISSLTISADADVFATDVENNAAGYASEITVDLGTADISSDHVLSVYLLRPWTDESIPSGTTLTFKMMTADNDVYVRSITTADATTFKAGYVNALKFNCNTVGTNVELLPFAGGSGVDGDPYLIGNERQMRNMDTYMVADQVTWFKLVENISMSDKDWTSLNNTADANKVFSKYINFDGNDKSISNLHSSGAYASLFGVLNGTVHDLSISGAVITPGENKSGVLAGYIGSGGTQDVVVSNINISGSTVGTSDTPGTYGCGILAAQVGRTGTKINNINISDSKVYCDGSGGHFTGGLLAQVAKETEISQITISGCTVVGKAKHTAGGIAVVNGEDGTVIDDITIENSSVSASAYTGGCIAEIGKAATLSNAKVTNTSVSGTLAGGVVGYANALVTVSGCYYTGNTVTSSARYAGGVFGSIGNQTSTISGCYVTDATITGGADRVGGFAGQINTSPTVDNCYAGTTEKPVTVRGKTINIGGFAGVGYCTISNCQAVATVSSENTDTGTEINLGGFIGYNTGTVSNCQSTVTIGTSTSKQAGRGIGGFCGRELQSGKLTKCTSAGSIYANDNYIGGLAGIIEVGTIEKCSSSTNVWGVNNCSAGIGWIKNETTVSDSYTTGNMEASGQRSGGFISLVESSANVSISNCYSSGTVSGSFSVGGLIARISNTTCTVTNCASWSSVSATKCTDANWSSGAVVGTTHPNCVLTDNYRNPNATYTVNWVPDSDYNHPNVNGTTAPLVIRSTTTPYTYTEATATALGSPYQFPYHGKVESGKTLSQLASTTLGWDSTIWDFSADLPTLK